jgi:hypothetical protein
MKAFWANLHRELLILGSLTLGMGIYMGLTGESWPNKLGSARHVDLQSAVVVGAAGAATLGVGFLLRAKRKRN